MAAGLIIGLSLGFMLIVLITTVVCLRRRAEASRNIGYTINEPPVVVTSATHTAPGGYQVTAIPATTYQPTTYSTPYPAQTAAPNITVQMPMPMPSAQPPMPGMQPHVAPYPPAQQFPGAGGANMSPPSYDAAMANSAPSVVPAGYEKQMPYNPNY
ncbi:actin cytoskeleton-regulatory complex protein PAN1 isoform X4 [Drosophila innubila]|uniref:actin cytoskeleton-regulatory complex protein PAN1 isoform X4 n=1 Tax=Drosophila innubila TaxID=198719 RepID=UPI00148B61BF|nr:actin cytoskeleton-regulatory complex protein PAN1 isoform X4 [Drosophila innubila]